MNDYEAILMEMRNTRHVRYADKLEEAIAEIKSITTELSRLQAENERLREELAYYQVNFDEGE